MRWIYKINIFSALLNKRFKNFNQPAVVNNNAFIFNADFIILAVNAFQVAATEKHSAAAVFTAYTWLFPKMECGTGKAEFGRAFAEADTVFPVCITFSRAN